MSLLLHRLAVGPLARVRTMFYGWWIVVGAFASYFIVGGLYTYGMSVYFLPVTRDLGLSRAALSFVFTLRALEGGIDGPVIGYLVDKIGARAVSRAGACLIGLGFVGLSFTQSYAAFLVVFIGGIAVGVSAGVHQSLLAIINQWFARRRSMAMTLGYIGGEVGGAIMTPVVAYMVLHHGWRETAFWSGLAIPVVMLTSSLLLRNTPESMGLQRDGAPPPMPPAAAGTPSAAGQADERDQEFTVKEAVRTAAFWKLAGAVGIRLFSKSGLQVHLIPLLVWKDMDEQSAALLVGLLAVSQVCARLLGAWAGDRWSATKVPMLASLAGVGAVAVVMLGPSGQVWVGMLFVMLFALGESGNLVSWGLIADFYGRHNYGSLRGIINFVQSPLSLPAATWLGWMFDQTGSYQVALIPLAVAYGCSALLYSGLKRPARRLAVAPAPV